MLVTLSHKQAQQLLLSGEVVATPSECCYGLSGMIDSQVAFDRILTLKKRPSGMGFVLLCSKIEQLSPWVDDQTLSLLYKKDGGTHIEERAISWSLKPKKRVVAMGSRDSMAVRLTKHPSISLLCDALGQPIISTSANLHGQAPAMDYADVERYFPSGLAGVLDGDLGGFNKPSTIIDLYSGEVLRP